MATGTRERANYWGTFQKHFVKNVSPDHPKAISRLNTKGRELHEERAGYMEGYIIKSYKTTREHEGKTYRNLNIIFHDGDTLQLNWKSNAALCFFQTMESINPEIMTELSLSYDDATRKTTLFVAQERFSLKWNYTKSSPGDKPEWVPYQAPDENNPGQMVTKYDRAAELQFFEDKLEILSQRWSGSAPQANNRPTTDEVLDAAMGVPQAIAAEERKLQDNSFPSGEMTIPGDDDDDLPF